MRTAHSRIHARHFAITALLLAAVAVTDYETGTEIRVYPLYFIPITYAASRIGRNGSYLASLACALSWLASNALSGLHYKSLLVWAWNTGSQALAFVFIGALVYRLEEARRREHDLSRRDSLTGLLNARGFTSQAGEILRLCRREGWPLVLAYVDLDHFKLVNDTEGHQRGDEVLRAAAQVILATVRSSDLVSRLGGDEFAILLPHMSPDAARESLDRLRSAMASAMKRIGCAVTASIGAVAYEAVPNCLEELIHAADAVMYSVKAAGRNQVVVIPGSMAPVG